MFECHIIIEKMFIRKFAWPKTDLLHSLLSGGSLSKKNH